MCSGQQRSVQGSPGSLPTRSVRAGTASLSHHVGSIKLQTVTEPSGGVVWFPV